MLSIQDKASRTENIARLIKELRSKGLSVPQIARKTGISRNTLYSWMSGIRNVKDYNGVVAALTSLMEKWKKWYDDE